MIIVDDKAFQDALKAIRLSADDLSQIEGAGARVQINGQRQRVPVDTGATRASVDSHIEESTEKRVVDEIGPETEYAPNIEYGKQDAPGYPIQPFVRPTAEEDKDQTLEAIATAFGQTVIRRWPK
jgi:hypothetical protein